MIPGVAFIMTLWGSIAAATRSGPKAAAAFTVTLQPAACYLSVSTISDADRMPGVTIPITLLSDRCGAQFFMAAPAVN
jgi:hypothetical protein